MDHVDAMKIGRDSLLKVVAELHETINTRWNDMITALEESGGDLHSPAADRLVSSDAFSDDRAHRFAAICALIRHLRDYAIEQGNGKRFDSVLLSLCKDGKSMYDVMKEVNEDFWSGPGPKPKKREDSW